MATVIVRSEGYGGEVEWEERFEANTLKAAKTAARSWIKSQLFASDYARIDKRDVGTTRAYWWIK